MLWDQLISSDFLALESNTRFKPSHQADYKVIKDEIQDQ